MDPGLGLRARSIVCAGFAFRRECADDRAIDRRGREASSVGRKREVRTFSKRDERAGAARVVVAAKGTVSRCIEPASRRLPSRLHVGCEGREAFQALVHLIFDARR